MDAEGERRERCKEHRKETSDLKYDYVGFKSEMKVKITIMMWLFGIQFAASMTALVKTFFTGG